jgi:DNA-binding XRE family transcriptional regulator
MASASDDNWVDEEGVMADAGAAEGVGARTAGVSRAGVGLMELGDMAPMLMLCLVGD